MYKINILLCCLAFGFTAAFAQNNTNSPYSMLGYGELSASGLAANKAMGGVGYGLRSNLLINTVNPAAYSSVDSMTVMFDFGLSGRITKFKEGENRASTTNGNLEYIAFQMPLIRNLGMSFGFTPFSFVGYNVTKQSNTSPGNITYTETFIGTGGINQLYGGLAYKIGNRFSLGFDANFAFGYIKHSYGLVINDSYSFSTSHVKNLQVNDLSLRYGAQANVWRDNRHSLTLGATYKHQSVLNGSFDVTTSTSQTETTTDYYSFDLPTIAGIGAFYSYRDRLSAGLDYTREQWADTRFYSAKDSLHNVNRFATGLSYVPNPTSRNYFNRIRYSLGGSVANSYVLGSANNYTLACGFAFPMRSAKSYLNTVFEYGNNKVGASSSSLQEQYFKITLSASISETWFFKRRLD